MNTVKSPIRILFILPIVLFIMIAIGQLFINGFLSFVLWGFVAVLVTAICWSIVIKANDRYVPIYHIFFILIAFIIVAITASYYELRSYLAPDKALILSFFLGFGITALIMFLKGKN